MRTILFQVIPDTEVDSVRGLPMWVFWLLIVVIIVLLIFILVRDRGVRDKLKKLFSWIVKKIRVARIKAKINQKKQKKQQLVIRLGKEVWEKKIEIDGIENEVAEIQKLKSDESKIKNEIQKIDKEIEQNGHTLEELTKDKEDRVSGIMDKKKPLDAGFKGYLKEKDILEKEIKEQDRLRLRTEKNISQKVEEIERTENDGYLSKIEKDMKKKELEQRISDLRNEEEKISTTIAECRGKLTGLEENNKNLDQEIFRYQDELDHINKDYEKQQKNIEEVIQALQKNKNALNIKNVGLQKQLSLAFEKLGEIANSKRIDSRDLMAIYSELDTVSKGIIDLENRLS